MNKLPDRFLTKFSEDPIRGCWIWNSGKNKKGPEGYGRYWTDGKDVQAHRYSYETIRGPIPDNMQIDHLCQTRTCVNPWHLEIVTQSINIKRSDSENRKKTHCPKGHPYEGDNLYVGPNDARRYCITCHRARNVKYRERKKAIRAMKEADNDTD